MSNHFDYFIKGYTFIYKMFSCDPSSMQLLLLKFSWWLSVAPNLLHSWAIPQSSEFDRHFMKVENRTPSEYQKVWSSLDDNWIVNLSLILWLRIWHSVSTKITALEQFIKIMFEPYWVTLECILEPRFNISKCNRLLKKPLCIKIEIL